MDEKVLVNALTIITHENLEVLTREKLKKAKELFNKYKNVFFTNDYDLGYAKEVFHEINIEVYLPI